MPEMMTLHWVLAHFIGDYLIQSDWMAVGKKKNSWICLVHVVTYMIPFLLCGLPWLILGYIALEHFWQDRTNVIVWFMKVKGSGRFATPPLAPWSIFVTDNIIHCLFIYYIIRWLA